MYRQTPAVMRTVQVVANAPVPPMPATTPTLSANDITAIIKSGTVPNALMANPQAAIIKTMCEKLGKQVRAHKQVNRLLKGNMKNGNKVIELMSRQFLVKTGKKYYHKFGTGKRSALLGAPSGAPSSGSGSARGRLCRVIGYEVKAVVVDEDDAAHTKKIVSQTMLEPAEPDDDDDDDDFDADFE